MPPRIPPVNDGAPRPRWSVMIPTYNCADYLRETLASVLAQDPGADQMQIEVVDDCSTRDDPAAVVRELAPDGRVGFYRHPANVGAIRNFNAGLERARGELIHLLHGDDIVLPGFYHHLGRLTDAFPQQFFFTSRALNIDENGVAFSVTPDFEREGMLEFSDRLFFGNPFATPAVVVRRSFYEAHGGFDPQYPHVADWDLWLRALHASGGAATRLLLAGYRVHRNNDTSRLVRTAKNLEDYHRLYLHWSSRRPDVDQQIMRYHLGLLAFEQASRFLAPVDRPAFDANRKIFRTMMGPVGAFLYQCGKRIQRQLGSVARRRVPRTLPPLEADAG